MKETKWKSSLFPKSRSKSPYQRILHYHPHTPPTTHNDIKLGVDMRQLVIGIHDGQCGHPPLHKLRERLNNGRVGPRRLYLLIRADPQLRQRPAQERWPRQIVQL